MNLLRRQKTLIAGPWLSELGWELMLWQAAVRHQRLSHKYDNVYVITFKNRECLYENCKVFAHDENLTNASFGPAKVPKDKIRLLTQACVDHFGIKERFDLFSPNTYCSLPFRVARKFRGDLTHRRFYLPGEVGKRYDIAFHFRDFEKKGDPVAKFFPTERGDTLVRLCRERGLEVCCIGAPGYSYVAKGAENRQSHDLARTISTICASNLVVGGSSSPMHLASLCEIPIVVWTGPPFNADRYFTAWNPFHSKVFVVTENTFNPTAKDVFEVVNQSLGQI